jgi:hypothetical protein
LQSLHSGLSRRFVAEGGREVLMLAVGPKLQIQGITGGGAVPLKTRAMTNRRPDDIKVVPPFSPRAALCNLEAQEFCHTVPIASRSS